MLKIAVLVLSVIVSSIGYSQISHDLEIYSENGEKFFLTINGRQMNDEVVNNIQIMNTDKDYVHVKIRFEDPAFPEIEKKMLQLAEPGNVEKKPVTVVYKIVEKKGVYKLVFVSRSQKKIQEQHIIIQQQTSPTNGRVIISW
jgi:hypothetical protein